MRLYIHFGIYKTGSSFLQTVCAQNRDQLCQKGIYFPESEREEDMLAGRISPGNGNGLNELINAADVEACAGVFENLVRKAETQNCSAILISSEALVHGFARAGGLDTMRRAAAANGITDLHCLGFLRNPVDHALSTFKHRAKKGKIKDFKHWLEHTYETMGVLEDFFTRFDQHPIRWTLRKYRKDSVYLAEAFFVDWLDLPLPYLPGRSEVNASMTLSEIYLIQQTAVNMPRAIPYIMRSFAHLPKKDKARDGALELYYRENIRTYLQRYNGLLAAINQHLPPGESLTLDLYESGKTPVDVVPREEAVLNRDQLRTYIESIQLANTLPARVKRVVKQLIRIARSRK